ELLSLVGVALLEELEVSTAAVAALLELGLVLDDKVLASGVERSLEWRGDSVVGGLGLGDEAFVSNDGGADGRLLDLPLADIGESLASDRSFLGRLAGSPALVPVISELLDKRAFDVGGLQTPSK